MPFVAAAGPKPAGRIGTVATGFEIVRVKVSVVSKIASSMTGMSMLIDDAPAGILVTHLVAVEAPVRVDPTGQLACVPV